MNREPLRVFYDGECGLCSTTVAWALRRDREGLLQPTPAQSAEAREAVGPERTAKLLEELHTWSPSDGVRSGPEAVASLFARLPGWRWAGALLLLPIVLPIARVVYRWIARHRSLWGKPSCPLPRGPSGPGGGK